MMSKPSIRKQDGCWVVQRPGYGFSPATVAEFESWKAAVGSLRSAPASAGASTERGHYTLGMDGWATGGGTIRMLDNHRGDGP